MTGLGPVPALPKNSEGRTRRSSYSSLIGMSAPTGIGAGRDGPSASTNRSDAADTVSTTAAATHELSRSQNTGARAKRQSLYCCPLQSLHGHAPDRVVRRRRAALDEIDFLHSLHRLGCAERAFLAYRFSSIPDEFTARTGRDSDVRTSNRPIGNDSSPTDSPILEFTQFVFTLSMRLKPLARLRERAGPAAQRWEGEGSTMPVVMPTALSTYSTGALMLLEASARGAHNPRRLSGNERPSPSPPFGPGPSLSRKRARGLSHWL